MTWKEYELTDASDGAAGCLVYTCADLERSVHYLKNRGFFINEKKVVRENNIVEGEE